MAEVVCDTFKDGNGFPFFVLTDNAFWIDLADVARIITVAVGLIVIGTSIWLYRSKLLKQEPGTTSRIAFLILATVSLVGTEYNRLNEPVTSRLFLNVAALAFGATAVYVARPPRPPTSLDE